MTHDEFEETYKPIQNHLNENACREGTMFETYDEELDFVVAHGLANQHTVWTILDIEPNPEFNEHGQPNPSTSIVSGYHMVNRHGYLITEKPYEEHIEVVDA